MRIHFPKREPGTCCSPHPLHGDDDITNCPAANQFDAGGGYGTPKGYYQITAPTLNGTQFTLRADAQGAQATDTDCVRLEMDQTGNRTPAACW